MAIRVPEKLNIGVSEIRHRDSNRVLSISKVFKITADHQARLVWEQTTFVDSEGKAFYDCNGIPFQGAK